MERITITVNTWNDHPLSREAHGHCMLNVMPGLWYHQRLDVYFLILSETGSHPAVAKRLGL